MPRKKIDKLIHEPARLSIMSNLYVVEAMDFLALKNLTGLSDGNIASHISKLETAKYVEVKKSFKAKKTVTTYSLTEKGRSAFDSYRAEMKKIIS
ncbi:transcriptional regulator [Candidatus Woesearchaeota archaeon]|nr:transcriptional regulator [Candidatus Woesearchaeota archaeon]